MSQMKVPMSTVESELGSDAMNSQVFTQLVHSRLTRILVIEDNVDLNQSLAARLRNESYRVQSAYDGIDGLEKFQLRPPDLVVLDLGLPRLGGYALLNCIRTTVDLDSVPVIILTGSDSEHLERNAWTWGVRKVLRKPMRQAKIVRAIREVLEEGN